VRHGIKLWQATLPPYTSRPLPPSDLADCTWPIGAIKERVGEARVSFISAALSRLKLPAWSADQFGMADRSRGPLSSGNCT